MQPAYIIIRKFLEPKQNFLMVEIFVLTLIRVQP